MRRDALDLRDILIVFRDQDRQGGPFQLVRWVRVGVGVVDVLVGVLLVDPKGLIDGLVEAFRKRDLPVVVVDVAATTDAVEAVKTPVAPLEAVYAVVAAAVSAFAAGVSAPASPAPAPGRGVVMLLLLLMMLLFAASASGTAAAVVQVAVGAGVAEVEDVFVVLVRPFLIIEPGGAPPPDGGLFRYGTASALFLFFLRLAPLFHHQCGVRHAAPASPDVQTLGLLLFVVSLLMLCRFLVGRNGIHPVGWVKTADTVVQRSVVVFVDVDAVNTGAEAAPAAPQGMGMVAAAEQAVARNGATIGAPGSSLCLMCPGSGPPPEPGGGSGGRGRPSRLGFGSPMAAAETAVHPGVGREGSARAAFPSPVGLGFAAVVVVVVAVGGALGQTPAVKRLARSFVPGARWCCWCWC